MAAALLAMNAVFGKFFDVLDVEAVEAAAFAERTGEPYFIFDVQTHYVGEPLTIRPAREAGRKGRSPSRLSCRCAGGRERQD